PAIKTLSQRTLATALAPAIASGAMAVPSEQASAASMYSIGHRYHHTYHPYRYRHYAHYYHHRHYGAGFGRFVGGLIGGIAAAALTAPYYDEPYYYGYYGYAPGPYYAWGAYPHWGWHHGWGW